MIQLVRSVSFVVSLGLAVVGCSSGEGGEGGGSQPSSSSAGGGGGAPDSFVASACGTCVHDACATAFDACYADPECPAFAECLDACPLSADGDADPACVEACPRGTGTESKRAAAKIDACRDPGPGASCEGCSVGARDATPDVAFLHQVCAASTAQPPCIACQEENCCETYDACIADPACAAYRECVKDAGDLTDACNEANPGGAALYAPDMVCAVYHCAIDTPSCDPAERDPCLACAYSKCALEWVTFEGSEQGFLLGNCIGQCPVGDDVCDEACYDRFPSATEDALAFGECVFTACGEEC